MSKPHWVTVSHRCPYLYELRIHFQTISLADATGNAAMLSPSTNDELVVRREDCALFGSGSWKNYHPGGVRGHGWCNPAPNFSSYTY